MENKRDLKLLLILVLCTGYFFSFSIFGEKAYERVAASKSTFQDHTTIGPVDISRLTNEEALAKLQEEKNKWLEETTIQLQYKEKKLEFDNSSFLFALGESLDGAVSGNKNSLVVDVADEMVTAAMIDFAMEEGTFNRAAFKQELLSYPSTLKKGVHTIKLENFIQQEQERKVISEATVTFQDNSEQIDLWLSEFPAVTIGAHSHFSLLDAIEEKGIKTFTTEGLSIIGTAIYKTVLPTNFTITERSISRELPYYAEAGYEAKVDRAKNMDLMIANPNDDDYVLQFNRVENGFHVSLSGPELLYDYRIVLAEKETFNPKQIVQFDPKLAPGQTRVKSQGKQGFLQKVYRETVDQSGVTTDKELLSEDFYPPVHTVVLKSSQPKPQIPQTQYPLLPSTNQKTPATTTPGTGQGEQVNESTEEHDQELQQEEKGKQGSDTDKTADEKSYYQNHTK